MNVFDVMDSTHIPLSSPPSGVTSNFVNPVSQARMVEIVSIICTVVVFISFVMRVYARLWITRTFQKDDGKTFPLLFDHRLRSNSCMSPSSGLYQVIYGLLPSSLRISLGGYDSLHCDLVVK